MPELKYVGQSVTRVDADEKVKGEAIYGYDLILPDMLYGKVAFSSRAHAKIKHIDTSKAKAYPGVVAVVTGKDAPWTHGETIQDKPFLAQDKVRFVGEPIAAVAAIDEDIAAAAAELITAEYEDLPAYLTPEDACKPDAVLIHEDYANYRKAKIILPGKMPNVLEHFKLRTGDVATAFDEADIVLEENYTVPLIQHAAMEPHAAHAQVDPETGRITIWTPNDAPFRAREELALALDVSEEIIRFINPIQGGGFGSKGGLKIEPIALALAFQTDGKPVRLKYTREETFNSTLTRHEAKLYIKSGVMKSGKLHARKMTIYWGSGAYSEKSATVCIRGSLFAPGPYNIPNVNVDAYSVYTNKTVSGAFRGYGIPQGAWACEQHMDELARRLDMDPVEFRLANIYEEGDISYWGEKLEAVGLRETLLKAAEAINWSEPAEKGIGRGLACIIKPTKIFTESKAAVLINDKGEVSVMAGTVEIGQGCNTILCQIAAEELLVTLDKIQYATLDTDVTPFDSSTTSSRSTYHMGNAVRRAAANLREQLMELVPSILGSNCEPENLIISDGVVSLKSKPESSCTFGEIVFYAQGKNGFLRGDGQFERKNGVDPDLETGQTPCAGAYYMYGTHAVEVKVDEETGIVSLLRIAAAHDVGKAINPVACAGQIEGGVIMGLGAALHEHLVFDGKGKIRNPSFLDYHLLTSADAIEIIPIIVETSVPDGPWGAKGVGEPPVAPGPAAVGNAVAQAIQHRIYDLPLTPERVYWAIQERNKKNIAIGDGQQHCGTD